MKNYQESSTLELKQRVTDTFLKTVSAYANYGTGEILFGVADNGAVVGIEDIQKVCLLIEQKINDSISPRPIYKINKLQVEEHNLIQLTVYKGTDVPYLYSGRAYKRSDTSSIAIDSAALRKLSIAAAPLEFDQHISNEEDLTFKVLEKALQDHIGINHFNDDILKTLGLIRNDQYTLAAELIADTNNNLQSATRLVRFGDSISVFLERAEISKKSILTQYYMSMDIIRKWYPPYEEIVGSQRVERIQIPESAYREALANALVHRRYDLSGAVQVAMYKDRIEISSPGGLPEGMTDHSYLYGNASILRNVTLAEIFSRLRIIEKFGTGIARIREAYEPYEAQPQFVIEEHSIKIILPTAFSTQHSLDDNLEETIMLIIGQRGSVSRKELEKETGYSKSRVYTALTSLQEEKKIQVVGSGKLTRYELL